MKERYLLLCGPYLDAQEHLEYKQRNKMWGVKEKGWETTWCCEACHSSLGFLSSSISLFYLQLHPPSRKRDGGEHKDSMCLVDIPCHWGVLWPSWTGHPWEKPPPWDFTGTDCEWSERNGWCHEVWAPHSNPSSRTVCVLSVPCHRPQRAPITLKWTQSKEKPIH